MHKNLSDIFNDSFEEENKKNTTQSQKYITYNEQELKDFNTSKKKWGFSKKSKKKLRKQKKKNRNKRLNLLEIDFDILFKNEENQEVIKNLKKLVESTFENQHLLNASEKLKEEDDYGDTEYKLKLIDTSSERIQHLTTQMNFRLKEGSGEAFYKIGYEDNGNNLGLCQQDFLITLTILCFIAKELKVDLIVEKIMIGIEGLLAHLQVRKRIAEKVKLELKIMLKGTGKSGKSTLLGVILSGKNDDGKGKQRIKILNHKHEVLTGVTSSLTYTVIGFDEIGNVLNNRVLNTWESTVDNSYKIISFIDCGGSEKHHRNSLQGYLACSPDYTIIVLSILNSLEQIQNQIEMTIGLQCTFALVVTHLDKASVKKQNQFIKYVLQKDKRHMLQIQ